VIVSIHIFSKYNLQSYSSYGFVDSISIAISFLCSPCNHLANNHALLLKDFKDILFLSDLTSNC
jgi:hypothetical protein